MTMPRAFVSSFRILLACLALAGTAACDDGSPTAPGGTANVAGAWTGTATSGIGGVRFGLAATMIQSGTSVSGTLTCTGSSSCPFPVTAIFGTVDGAVLKAQTTSGGNVVCASFTATVTGNAMAGSYDCTYGDSGSWSMTR